LLVVSSSFCRRSNTRAGVEEIAESFHLGLSTVHRTRQRFVEEGLTAAF
jgi:DNA-binding IclR family transcriptional regulator